ncbi:MAG: tyrosine-type recombinase/integrase [Phycicoccus sp.]|nr:tyrosine-type recombinase/integrase [Phycicoccus sp.]
MVRPKSRVSKVSVVGPLAPFADDFSSTLESSGYTPLTIVNQLRLMAHVSRWMDGRDYSVADLTDEVLEEYLAAAHAAGRVSLCSQGGLGHLLRALPIVRVNPEPPPGSTAERLLISFRRYLLDERGLAESTATAYVLRARRFLTWCAADGNVSALTTGDVTRTVLRESQNVSVGSVQFFVAALRSFLRFCFVEGVLTVDLAPAALAVTGRRRSSLPRGISPTDARALLRACDRRQAAGRRDYAVILTLLRLGLRASEVASLTLDDIDWRAAELLVHGKGRRDERLPLPVDVGEAVVGYLQRGRPATTSRAVFVRRIAPIGPLGRGGVSFIVRYASVRAGLAPMGAHRLRHTLACQMVRAGVPLPEISQVLRHRSLGSTANYARVDVAALRGLARPWPSLAGGER